MRQSQMRYPIVSGQMHVSFRKNKNFEILTVSFHFPVLKLALILETNGTQRSIGLTVNYMMKLGLGFETVNTYQHEVNI